MHSDLIESRKFPRLIINEWLALSRLAPGPLAAQLAMYRGYVLYRMLGATLVGVAFASHRSSSSSH